MNNLLLFFIALLIPVALVSSLRFAYNSLIERFDYRVHMFDVLSHICNRIQAVLESLKWIDKNTENLKYKVLENAFNVDTQKDCKRIIEIFKNNNLVKLSEGLCKSAKKCNDIAKMRKDSSQFKKLLNFSDEKLIEYIVPQELLDYCNDAAFIIRFLDGPSLDTF